MPVVFRFELTMVNPELTKLVTAKFVVYDPFPLVPVAWTLNMLFGNGTGSETLIFPVELMVEPHWINMPPIQQYPGLAASLPVSCDKTPDPLRE